MSWRGLVWWWLFDFRSRCRLAKSVSFMMSHGEIKGCGGSEDAGIVAKD